MGRKNTGLTGLASKTSKNAKIKIKVSGKKVSSTKSSIGKNVVATTKSKKKKIVSDLKSKMKNSSSSTSSKTKLTSKSAPKPKNNSSSKTLKSKNKNIQDKHSEIPKLTSNTSVRSTKVNHKGSNISVNGDPAGLLKIPLDKSQINFPYDIRINGFSSLLTTVQKSTPKVQQLLLSECDIILECRFCRNLFRSIPNFLSHKQTFCKAAFHPSSEVGCSRFLQSTGSSNEIEYRVDSTAIDALPSNTCYSNYINQDTDSHFDTNAVIAAEDNETRSALSLYSDISTISQQNHSNQFGQELSHKEIVNLVLEPVENRRDTIVYQRKVVATDPSICDSSNPIYDSREVADRDTAILGPDGKIICTGTARGIEKIVKHLTAQIDLTQRKMVQSGTNLSPEKCDICKTVFNTEKAFRQHRRDAPDCVKQSTVKMTIGAATNSSNLPMLKSSTRVKDLEKSDGTSTCLDVFSPPNSKRTKIEDEAKSNKNNFVKKLFTSPSKKLSTPATPCKSPLFAKKLLSSGTGKLSSYKKTVGKAVKNLQNPSSHQTLAPKFISEKLRYSDQLPFSCIKCSGKFHTTSEMSVHLATMCTDLVNVSLSRNLENDKKIGILVRQDYSKLHKDDWNYNNHNLLTNISPSISAKKPIISTINKLSVAKTNTEVFTHKVESTVKKPEQVSPETNSKFQQEVLHINTAQEINKKETREDPSTVAISVDLKFKNGSEECFETATNGISSICRLIGETEKSESEGDQETKSNVTDSGLSSSTAVSDGLLESSGEPEPILTLSLTDAPLINARKKSKLTYRTRKNVNSAPDDRVLTPKNKNLKACIPVPIISRKRTSSRNIEKKETVENKLKLSKKN